MTKTYVLFPLNAVDTRIVNINGTAVDTGAYPEGMPVADFVWNNSLSGDYWCLLGDAGSVYKTLSPCTAMSECDASTYYIECSSGEGTVYLQEVEISMEGELPVFTIV